MLQFLNRLWINIQWSNRKLQKIEQHLICLENELSQLRDDFNAGLANLNQAITDLAARIAALPDSADDLTQADLDAVKGDATALASLANSAPPAPAE